MHSVFDEPVDDEFISLAKKNHALYCPTLFVMESYELALSNQWRATPEELKRADPRDPCGDGRPATRSRRTSVRRTSPSSWRIPSRRSRRRSGCRTCKRVSDAGVTIVMGTDAGNIGTLHGPSIHREMEMMVESGLTPLQVLRSATFDGAKAMGLEGKAGEVEAGMLRGPRDPRRRSACGHREPREGVPHDQGRRGLRPGGVNGLHPMNVG